MNLRFLEGKTVGIVYYNYEYYVIQVENKAYKIYAEMEYDEDMAVRIEETSYPYDLYKVGLITNDELKEIRGNEEKEKQKKARERDEMEYERLKKMFGK